MSDSWKEVKKRIPHLRYSSYVRIEIKWFFIGRFSDFKHLCSKALWFLREPLLEDPADLTKDSAHGLGAWWWVKALCRAGLLCLLFFNPLKYIRECLDRKDWWDGMTEGQRHWHIEEQQRLVNAMIEPLDKLLESLKKPRSLNEKGEYEHTNES